MHLKVQYVQPPANQVGNPGHSSKMRSWMVGRVLKSECVDERVWKAPVLTNKERRMI